jgi:hypothetical protein
MSVTGITAAEVLRDHVTLEVESIDRMYLNVYVPRLQMVGSVVHFFREHRGESMATGKRMSDITVAFREEEDRFVERDDIPVVHFEKKQKKDEVMAERLRRFDRPEGVIFLGVAQEKTRCMRTIQRKGRNGRSYPWIVDGTAMVNHYYFYAVDQDFGPFFLKFCTYFPYNAKLCINGHEYLKRQLRKRGIEYEALDNGIRQCEDRATLQKISDELSAEKIDAFFRKWLKRLPHPFTKNDQDAGYQYELSIWQAEFSLTQVFDRPVHGRIFFDEVIRENLDLGRPDQIQLLFNRRLPRRTRAAFRTRVITEGVTPSLHVHYKRTHLKQYFKEGRALRTETTINETRDFGVGRSLSNLPALRKIGFAANRRLLDVERISHDCTIGQEAFEQLGRPITVGEQRVPSLPFHNHRVQALFAILSLFVIQAADGFRAKQFRSLLASLLGLDPAQLTPGRVSYDLRRLRLRGLIQRIPRTSRYRVTSLGLRTAIFCSRVYTKVIRPGLSTLDPLRSPTAPLGKAVAKLQNTIDTLWDSTNLPRKKLDSF